MEVNVAVVSKTTPTAPVAYNRTNPAVIIQKRALNAEPRRNHLFVMLVVSRARSAERKFTSKSSTSDQFARAVVSRESFHV